MFFNTQGGGDYIVGRDVRLESSGDILGANQGKLFLDRKHLRFLVQMIDRCHLNATGDYVEGRVLDILELISE